MRKSEKLLTLHDVLKRCQHLPSCGMRVTCVEPETFVSLNGEPICLKKMCSP